MPDQGSINPAAASAPAIPDSPTTTPSDAVVAPTIPEAPASAKSGAGSEIYAEVASKISDAHNVLIALSSDPSVDEMSAAIGLSLYLDKLGKRATAIYSGQTPNALEFLKPEETFEPTVDTLQDFVIALNKDKADHLRYKLDGDYVKIYITPYRTRISEEDLDFSYGDFNVDLVLALDVANGIDLDSALREHGRIMHDAVIINITTGNPGKFGEIEWSDKSASSVSEMIAKLLFSVNSKIKIEKEEATAFLTGIVAATNRFSNASTTPETMKISSRLMESGANQQLISKNITPDIENEMFSLSGSVTSGSKKRDNDPTKLDIEHGNEEGVDETKVVDDTITEKESTLLDDLKAAEASLSQAGAETTPDTTGQPVKLEDLSNSPEPSASPSESTPSAEPIAESTPEPEPEFASNPLPDSEPAPAPDSGEPILPPVTTPTDPTISPITTDEDQPPAEKVIQPSADFASDTSDEGTEKYSKMLEEALANADATTDAPQGNYSDEVTPQYSYNTGNPAATSAPEVASTPEINGVPEMNYSMPMPGEEILPPPPAPPIDMSTPPVSTDFVTPTTPVEPITPTAPAAPIAPAVPVAEPTPEPLGPQPAMQDQVYAPQVSDPAAFKIPGM